MNTQTAIDMTTELIKKHELSGWSVKIDRRPKGRLGQCRLYKREIGLTGWHVEGSEDNEVIDTILHELAHALAWVRYGSRGHCAKWRAMCIELGAVPKARSKRLETNKMRPSYKWSATCTACNTEHKCHRITKKYKDLYSCTCQKNININKRIFLVFKENKIKVLDASA